ncbi:MAG TPA: hypothetical protein VFH31_20920 [Pyrinomonadaceae bacterium]|nr:hypothetical protein [Pyrinomonadaceae bacterium]
MHPINDSATLDARYRTLVILWFALFCSIGLFFLLTLLAPSEVRENNAVSLTLAVLGTLAVIASYFVKRRYLNQAVDKQDVALVQVGTVVAAALNEVAAMLGFLDHILTGNRYYYVLMLMAVIGSLLNFPHRDHLLAASYKSPEPKDPWK